MVYVLKKHLNSYRRSQLTINILFVCSKNQWRSPTAEAIYREDPRFQVRSAGINSSARRKINEKGLIWADLVLVMENKHKKAILARYRNLDLPDILVLDIPDDYQYMSEELIAIIQETTETIIASWNT